MLGNRVIVEHTARPGFDPLHYKKKKRKGRRRRGKRRKRMREKRKMRAEKERRKKTNYTEELYKSYKRECKALNHCYNPLKNKKAHESISKRHLMRCNINSNF